MKIAITGSTGFVGVHLIHHLLQQGHELVALHRSSSSMFEFDLVKDYYSLRSDLYEQLQWVECELYDTWELEHLFAHCDLVIHLAGFISYQHKDKDKLLTINQSYTAFVCNAAKAAGVSKLIYLSSTAAISKSSDGTPTKESNPWDPSLPHSFYGLSKQLGELEAHRISEEGLSVTILNPGIILGYGDWRKGSLKLFKNANKRFPLYSSGTTAFVGVEDVCRIIEHFSKIEGTTDRYILSSEVRSFKSVAFKAAIALEQKPPYIEVKGWIYKLIYAVLSVKDLLRLPGMLSRETARSAVGKGTFNATKLRNALPFDLEPIDSVIQTSCRHYKKNSPPLR